MQRLQTPLVSCHDISVDSFNERFKPTSSSNSNTGLIDWHMDQGGAEKGQRMEKGNLTNWSQHCRFGFRGRHDRTNKGGVADSSLKVD
jgi:hypothetical protein